FNFNCETIELVGEGALKAAYEKLKAKLEAEGVFDPTKKRPLPEYPHKIGLITSNKGDAIHDFTSNLGKYGYAVKFLDSRVEGQQAVKDLLEAVEYFKDQDIDVLVLVRGGGAWEALQAYNNEMLVRAVRDFPKPVLVGVGHEKDVTLVALAADLMVSTPTATAKALNRSWDHAAAQVRLAEGQIVARFADMLVMVERQTHQATQAIEMYFRRIFEGFRRAEVSLESHALHFGRGIEEHLVRLRENYQTLVRGWKRMASETGERIGRFEETLILHDPERPLRLGYSIVRTSGKIIKSIKDITLGEPIDVRVSDGTIRADIVAFKNVNYEGK
ncbi:MAG TPA: exodeoxyribonuclease VII large subunit, partial [Candidatus Paceibacterota bacterium]|nr:exodeoxyribonuclease VII large subunit [Candidatus Paceibacterota bacterium]